MSPWQTLILLIFWVVPVVAGYHLGKWKGQVAAGLVLTILLGLLGLLILSLIPRSEEAKVAAAQRDMAVRYEAARRAGYPYPPQPPPEHWAPPPGQWAQPPPGQWVQPPPGQWAQPPPGQWQGPQQGQPPSDP